MIITIRREAKNYIYIQIFFLLFISGIISFFHLPSFITYLTDIITILLILPTISAIKNDFSKTELGGIYFVLILIILSSFLGFLINNYSIALYIWGFRNTIRFFFFFLACIHLLTYSDIEKIFRLLNIALVINVVLSTFQYFVLHYTNDYNGGIFGITKGCNSRTVVFISAIWCFNISYFICNKIKIKRLIAVAISCLYIAVLAELKVFFAIFILAILICILLSKPSKRTILIMFCIPVILILAVLFLSVVAPKSVEKLTFEGAKEYLAGDGGYTSSNDLNRFNAISKIKDKFFQNDLIKNTFGFGLGSCEDSSIRFFQSEFYRRYYALHYRWFTHAMTYIEMGFLGLFCLYFFFFKLYKIIRKIKAASLELYLYSVCFTIVTIICTIYNNTLKIDDSYLVAVFLSVPVITYKTIKENEGL